MLKKKGIMFSILNAIAGCVAGIYLVLLTSNYWFFLINVITGGASGFMFGFAISGEKE